MKIALIAHDKKKEEIIELAKKIQGRSCRIRTLRNRYDRNAHYGRNRTLDT